MEELTRALTILDRADRHNAALTADELSMWTWFVESELPPNPHISSTRLAEFFAISFHDSEVMERLRDIYVPADNAVIDEAQFVLDFTDYLATQSEQYLRLDMLVTIVADEEAAEEAFERLLNEEITFEALVRELNPEIPEDEELVPMTVQDMVGILEADAAQAAALYAMQPGELFEIVEWNGLYLLIYALSREEANIMEMEISLRAQQVEAIRNQQFVDEIDRWVQQANPRINQRAFRLA